ncbi:AraC family transcriptional regulator [Plantactinospora sp. KLBMP9567]|uniref:helix-turn-helix domain-containing protein n=1 Tax=Plantactinospora sp. KLBMP9567 TaxID=3085900 RepID=UPI0029828BE5|nr:AraC family transcriptional regulator [Plantactinospora sp. KLBMP9567]MDW5322497.1 AraC family transcriptional regulator [Plantactinospora sp. KLBMP9567]
MVSAATPQQGPPAGRGPWRRDDLTDVVLLVGPAQAYRDAVHDDFKLVLLEGHGGTVRRRDAGYRVPPGRLVVHHPGTAHAGTPDDPDGRWRVMCVPVDLVAEVTDPVRLRFDPPVLPDPGLAHRYVELFGLFEGPTPALACEAGLFDLVLALAKVAGAAPPPGTVRAAAIAEPARDHLAAHLDQNVTLAALAGVTGTSRFGVTRACVAHFGLPPHALHLRLRLDHGCELIRRGVPLAEASVLTGFHDQAHFARTFARTYGMTPRQFRDSWTGRPGPYRKQVRRL